MTDRLVEAIGCGRKKARSAKPTTVDRDVEYLAPLGMTKGVTRTVQQTVPASRQVRESVTEKTVQCHSPTGYDSSKHQR